jgi:hypothetical protein
MPESKRSPEPTARNPVGQLLSQFFSVVIVSGILYYLLSFFGKTYFLSDFPNIAKTGQYGIPILFFGFGTWGAVTNFVGAFTAAQARQANQKVAEALNQIKAQTPDKNVSEISTQDVAASLKDTKVNNEQLTRLVEQGKQQLLIDDEYFREELSSLIVDYLQPLPRNAKRLLNRFRVNLLIAHSRGLLTSEPKVTAQQIGKWLVLLERWPQLGRSLSATPAKMKILEDESNNPAASQSDDPQLDLFMESIKALVPPYSGDEDLRRFIHSKPNLAIVAQRLIHLGADELSNPVAGSA